MHTSPSGKRYIGITSVKTYNRWGAKGQRYIYNKNKEVTYFGKAILKYGWDNITHEILFENLSKDEACSKEQELIAEYKSNQYEFGYNCTSGGEHHTLTEEGRWKCGNAFRGKKHTEETKKKLSEINKGKKMSPESIEKMRQTKLAQHKHLSEEEKANLSKYQKGKKYPKGTHINYGCFKKGHVVSEEVRNKLRGQKRTEEQRKHISESKKGKPWSAKRREAFELSKKKGLVT